MKTVLSKNGQEVVINSCHKFIGNSLKHFHIEETDQYFVSEKRAIRAGNDLLLKKTLPKFKYEERRLEKKRRIGANKIVHIYDYYIDTLRYIKRWEGIIYLETKKRLLAESKHKLNELLIKYDFTGIGEATAFLERRKK